MTTEPTACAECGRPLRPGRRSDARFCEPACQWRSANRRRTAFNQLGRAAARLAGPPSD